MTNYTLDDTPVETWGNTILYRLAEALEYPKDAAGGYTVDPDEILDDALEILWMYREQNR